MKYSDKRLSILAGGIILGCTLVKNIDSRYFPNSSRLSSDIVAFSDRNYDGRVSDEEALALKQRLGLPPGEEPTRYHLLRYWRSNLKN